MIGCLIGLFVWPFRFLRWCFTNGIKGYIILGVTLVVLLIGFFVIRTTIHNQFYSKPASQQASPGLNTPSAQVAPYFVETNTRTYYAKLAVKDNKTGNVTLTDWWELISGKWALNNGVLTLETATYGSNITIRRR